MTFVTFEMAFHNILYRLVQNGERVVSRAGVTRELIGHSFRVLYPMSLGEIGAERSFSPIYAAGEFMWYMSLTGDGDHICAYAPGYRRFLEPDGHANGAYGARWARGNQLRTAIRLLSSKPETRQAVLTMFTPADLVDSLGVTRDIPCTLSLQFLVRSASLHLIVTMRSNDAWLGLPNDVWCYQVLQMLFAKYLGLSVGEYTHSVGSLHLYEKDLPKAIRLLDSVAEPWTKMRPDAHNWCEPRGDVSLQFDPDRLRAVAIERSFRENPPVTQRDYAEQREMLAIEWPKYSLWRMLLELCLMNFVDPSFWVLDPKVIPEAMHEHLSALREKRST